MASTERPGDTGRYRFVPATLFEARNFADPRYVWDPMVHKDNGEHCYFAVLRLREQRHNVLDGLHKIAREIGIPSFTAYKIFGHHDVLMRFWTTGARADELKDRLAPLKSDDSGINLTTVEKAFYDDWTTHAEHVDAAYLDRHEAAIALLAASEITVSREEVTAAIRELDQAKLIHVIDARKVGVIADDPAVKIYIALTPSSDLNEDTELAAIRNIVSKMDELLLKSVYWCGSQRMAFFIKAIIPGSRFGELDGVLDRFEQQLTLRQLYMRMTTYIIANSDARESDALSANLPESSGRRWERLISQLSPEGEKALAEQPLRYQERVYDLYAAHRIQAMWQSFEREFRDVLTAVSMRDLREFRKSLWFLGDLEDMLKQYVESALFRESFGDQWYEEIISALEGMKGPSLKLSTGKNRELTLADYLRALGKLTSTGRIPSEPVEQMLGVDWLKRLDSMRTIRNDATHSRLKINWDVDANGTDAWFEIAGQVLALGAMYNRLEEWRRRDAAREEDI